MDAAVTSVSGEMLRAKIAEVEATAELDEAGKSALIELYRRSLTNLEAAASNAAATAAFGEAAQRAPAEIQALRRALEASQAGPGEDPPTVGLSTSLLQIDGLLQAEQAELAGLDARHADLVKRLEEAESRPATIGQRVTEAKRRLEEVATQLQVPPPADQSPAMGEARRWTLETRYSALRSEIEMLDRELSSLPIRLTLLEAKRDEAAAAAARIGPRVKALEDLVNRKRRLEAEEAQVQAEETRRLAEGEHPLLMRVAERKLALTEELNNMASRLDLLDHEQASAEALTREIEEDHRHTRESLEIGGLSQNLGRLLLEQRQSLPELAKYRRKAGTREEQIAEAGVRRLENRKEARRIRDIDRYVAELALDIPEDEKPGLSGKLRDLATELKTLLDTVLEAEAFYLRQLRELYTAERRLLEVAGAYEDFLDEHLLWVRTTKKAQLEELRALPAEVRRLFSPTGWFEVGRVLAHQARHSPAFALLALALGTLLWSRKRLLAEIRATGERVGIPATDRFAFTLKALVLTFLVAATWPLVLGVAGWQIRISSESTAFADAVPLALIAVAVQLYFLRAFHLICMPSGLAARHFGWPESSLPLLRGQLDFLTWVFLPTALISLFALNLDPVRAGGVIGRIFFVVFALAMALFYFRVLHPARGVLAGFLKQQNKGRVRHGYRFLYPLLVAVPIALGLLALAGYRYTAGTLMGHVMLTTWMVAGLLVLYELAVRSLLIVRRRLAYKAEIERRESASAKRETAAPALAAVEVVTTETEEPVVDLIALSEEGRKLLSTAVVFAGLVGLWAIWADVLPALRILDDIELWHHKVTVDGEEKLQPITLANIGLAAIYALATIVLAKRLPAILEIVLLQRFDMQAASRFTVTTLTAYSVAAIGILAVFNTIGASWSQLQWMAAALSVGIGFGLQEIVANFVSGIIILFERPIRVGDVVTVGDTDGVVTKIRIRATTIRNYDGKELLVPNKEFITGRLLNWSLSDQTTRVVIAVGVAYGSDVRKAMSLLLEAAAEDEQVLADPAPSVIFQGFGDNSLAVLLRCFVASVDVRYPTISALNEAINDKFNAADITMAFPQRDVHLDIGQPLDVRVRYEQPGTAGTPRGGD